MANPDWGTKRVCQACGTKYYDLEHEPIVCPSCGVEFDPEALLKSRRRSSAPKVEKEVAKPAPVKVVEDEEDETEEDETADIEVDDDVETDDDDDDAVIEDVSDLGDDDDLDEVVVEKDDDTER